MERLRPGPLIRFHDAQLRSESPLLAMPAAGELMDAIAANHHYNQLLWRTEDQARRTDVPDRQIVQCKRAIDRYNQQRNDAVERIDDALLRQLAGMTRQHGARQHSETAGAMIDRLSILSLKIFHMGLQAARSDASHEHLSDCRAKWQRLQDQRADLAVCLGRLMRDSERGHVYFKPYHQFKMYNDPRLNPWLTAGASSVPADAAADPSTVGPLR